MVNGTAGSAGLGHLHTLYRAGVLGDLTDAQLLERFLAGRDEGAEAGFAALVERHGPMVLRVCGRILRDPHDAEDAFQATFLVLARRAGSVRRRDSLASWLHGIARRVALHARADAARRRRHEGRCAALREAEPTDDGAEPLLEGWPELHEEVARLPAAYRESVVLCYLEGLTTAAAARRLGCAQGTVLARLSRARARLRRRLVGRGLALSAGLLAADLAPGAAGAAVPAGLARSVNKAAMEVASGATAAGSVPASVAALAQGVLSMMFRSRLKGIVGLVVALGAVVVGIGMLAQRSAGAWPQDAPAAAPAARDDSPRPGKDGRLAEIIVRAADLTREPGAEPFMGVAAINPETGRWRTIYKGVTMGPGPVSPDGRYLVYSSLGVNLPPEETGIWIHDLTGRTPRHRIFERRGEPVWADDGRRVVIAVSTEQGWGHFETWRVDADGSNRARLPIPEGDLVLDASRDGTWLATRTVGGEPRHHGRLTLVHQDGNGARHLTEGSAIDDRFSISRISPDGRRVAYAEITNGGKPQMVAGVVVAEQDRQAEVFIVDIDGRSRRRIPTHFERGTTVTVFWSPDGSRLALNALSEKKLGSIVLVDLDGPNFRLRTLPLPPGRWNLLVADWRTLAPGLRLEATDAPPDLQTPRGRYKALLDEYEQGRKAYGRALKAAKTEEDRRKAYRERFPQARPYVGRFLRLAESAPSDPSAIEALVWIVQFDDVGPEFERAIDLLARDHAGERPVGLRATGSLVGKVSPAAERLFRAVLEKSPDRYVRGMEGLWLGQHLRRQADAVRSVRDDKASAARMETVFREYGGDKEAFERFRRRDPDALMAQAEAAFERVVREYAEIPGPRDRTLGEEARAELNEIRNLVPGKPAPEVTGSDIDGHPMTLSDHRGRVVLLVFWGSEFGSSRAMGPFQRALEARMQGRPFILLGVHAGTDKDRLRALIKEAGITWPAWWDGSGGRARSLGPIRRQFNVHSWPTYYLIDHRGVIRHKFNGGADPARLDAAIDALVAAAERDHE
jgi:RNA polymerase sigma factor (sigma-70 family)